MEDTDAGMVREGDIDRYDGLVEELERSSRELVAAREQLERWNEQLSLFAGQVSHDLRTPLTAILANAEMLSGEPVVTEDPDLGWMVDGISRAAHRMNTMIEQMLDYAREGGAPVLRSTSLAAVFELALDDLAPVVAEKRAEVTLAQLPTLTADAGQLYDVALNLLSNALKFARPDTPPRVEVIADRVDGRWRVSVTDNGIGVDPERQQSMFVLFTRADKRVDGSGIGLAIAKRVVEAHGGRIGMESAPGGGTTVWFELPA
jgi:signal transduction histidine kinase